MRRYAGLGIALLLVLSGVLFVPPAQASHAVVAVTNTDGVQCTNGGDNGGFTITGVDRLMIFAIDIADSDPHVDGTREVTAVEWVPDGEPERAGFGQLFTQQLEANYETKRLEIWTLLAPRVMAGFVSWTASTVPTNAFCTVVAFTGVHQGVPFARASGPTTQSSVNANGISATVASVTGALVYDVLHGRVGAQSCPTAITQGAGQTLRASGAGILTCIAVSTEPGANSVTMSWTHDADCCGATEHLQHVVYNVFQTTEPTPGGTGGSTTPVVGGYGTFDNSFDVEYPDSFDRDFGRKYLYRDQKAAVQCSNITIEDTRSQAALAILYVWNFGDGKQEQTTKGSVGHVYEKEGLYTVTVRVQYRSGAVEVMLINVNARGTQCIFSEFVNDWFPILLLLIGLMLLAAFTVQAAKYRGDPDSKRLLKRLFLLIALTAFGIMAAIVVYTSAMGIPI